MFSISPLKILQRLFILASLGAGVTGFLALCILFGVELPVQKVYAMLGSSAVIVIILIYLWILSRRKEYALPRGIVAMAALITTATITALVTLYQLAAYISLPVDLLNFSESPFVNDIVNLRLGMPIYTSPQDNSSYPYAPGTQVLTYLISTVFRHGDSIPFYRVVQFSYVVLATVVAVSICDLLARKFLSEGEYRQRPLWISAWLPFLFLIATDPRFNLNNHALHNDGLALLVSVLGFWLIVRHSITPRLYLLGLMAVLPALGFLVKQSLLIWGAIFLIYLMATGNVRWRGLLGFMVCSAAFVSTAVGVCYLLWGTPFLYWTFSALGEKQVSLLRSVLHLFQAGIYAIMGLLSGWMLVLRGGSRTSTVLWVCWLLVFGAEVYTSGIGFMANHLGPGVVIGACWFLVALVRIWPTAESIQSRWQNRAQEAVAVCIVVLLFGALGFIREPRNPVPPDVSRYVADIEKEFQGLPSEKVLMDTGTWIYLRENVLMRDRSAPVSLHIGKNQPKINHAALAATIQRIEKKTYDKILARQLDTGETWYDYQNRGSGVKAAILANYNEVRRIPGVKGSEQWLQPHLLSEILVLVPNRGQDSLSVSPTSIPIRLLKK